MSERQFNNPNELLENILEKNDIPRELFDDLLEQEKSRVHLQRRRGITKTLRQIIDQNDGKHS